MTEVADYDEATEGPTRGPDTARLSSVLAQVRSRLPTWTDKAVIKSKSGNWRPHLAEPKRRAVLHVHLTTRIRPYLAARLRAAAQQGRRVHIVLELGTLYDDESVSLFSDLDPEIYVLKEDGSITDGRPLLISLVEEGVPVSPALRTTLGELAWKQRRKGNAQLRGRRFEGLLAFLLAQVADFRVRERNLRCDTDELDIVVQIDNHSNRCWQKSGAPFVLVEAKNWTTAVPQKEVSTFITKLITRQAAVRLGLMFGAADFTSDARTQVLKFATTDFVVALIGPAEFARWIVDSDSDEYLESLVRQAMLR